MLLLKQNNNFQIIRITYYFNQKTNMWRYYDLKTGQLQINSGHVVGIADVEQYENVAQYLIQHQLKLYAHKPLLTLFIKNLCDDFTLSWSERVIKDYPDINPV